MRITTRRGRAALCACWALVLAGLAPVATAAGQTLEEALSRAYLGNPTLNSGRATLRSVDEGVPQARAQSRPSASVTGSAGRAVTHAGITDYKGNQRIPDGAAASGYPNGWYPTTPRTVGVAVTQPIYKGGGIDAGIQQAEATVLAQRAALLDNEQTVLLLAATAYLDVVQTQALLDLQTNFEAVQKRDLEAFQGRFRAGEVTLTDVSLQQAQVASATAARISAEGALMSARAAFAKMVGAQPSKLVLPRLSYPLPATLDEAVAQARGHSPKVVTAVHSESAARAAIDVADSGLLPTVSVTAAALHNLDRTKRDDFSTAGSVIANLSIPLDGGGLAAKSRAARQSANAARINVEQAARVAEESATSAWQVLATARAGIVAYQAAVKANELAAEGMRQQVAVGSSTVIDLLNTEQTLLNSRVNLVKARHDESVSVFSLLASVG
ncbi:MAG: TolC family outer membrane protein, partial [Rhodospirillaceae bacterium]